MDYGNTAADNLWDLTVLSPAGTRLLAIGSHLLMLIVVVALTRGRTGTPRRAQQSAT